MNFAVVFDMDGVLMDSEPVWNSSWRKAVEELGYLFSQPFYDQCVGRNERDTRSLFMEHYGPGFPMDAAKDRMTGYYEQQIREGIPRKPGAAEILEGLKNKGIPLALATSTDRFHGEMALKTSGLFGYFDAMVFGNEVKSGKPDPEIYLTACRRLSMAPEQTYGVEDSYAGMRALRNAGMPALMVPDLYPANEEMREIACRVFATLVEAWAFLQALPA